MVSFEIYCPPLCKKNNTMKASQIILLILLN
jgi:hypothetical protein